MSAALFERKVPAAPDADPNTTAPTDDMVFTLPTPQGGYLPFTWQACLTGTCTTQLWMFEPTLNRWFKVNAVSALTNDVLHLETASTLLGCPSVPTGVKLFLQVTVVGTATKVVVGTLLGGST